MKTVWILERFIPREETLKNIAEMEEYMTTAKTEDERETWKRAIDNLKAKGVDGRWLGYLGRSNYRAFCFDAKYFILDHKNDLVKTGIRVVKAEIPDDAKKWTGYVNPIVNDGVLRYIYTTV